MGVSLAAGGGGIARGASLKSKGSVPINEQMYMGDSICANNTTQTPLNRYRGDKQQQQQLTSMTFQRGGHCQLLIR